jgi:hypothetical protein
MPAGRPRKSTEQLKLSGTYRKDRHEKNADLLLENFLDVPGVELIPPESIVDPYCQEHYKYHTNFLIKLKVFTVSDLPELEMLYNTLQQYRMIHNMLPALEGKEYIEFTKLLLKLSSYFSKVAQKYYISPAARMRLQLDHLNLEKAQAESNIAKLLKKKRA